MKLKWPHEVPWLFYVILLVGVLSTSTFVWAAVRMNHERIVMQRAIDTCHCRP